MQTELIGKKIICSVMPDGSNYRLVTGEVIDIRNGYAVINISGYQTIFDEHWYQGNGFQQTSALVENCILDVPWNF